MCKQQSRFWSLTWEFPQGMLKFERDNLPLCGKRYYSLNRNLSLMTKVFTIYFKSTDEATKFRISNRQSQ